jgi:hypothetical protein
MDIYINQDGEYFNEITMQKMIFLFNALEDGWNIKKNKDSYIFTKKHEGKKEILNEDFLKRFIERNFDKHKIN